MPVPYLFLLQLLLRLFVISFTSLEQLPARKVKISFLVSPQYYLDSDTSTFLLNKEVFIMYVSLKSCRL